MANGQINLVISEKRSGTGFADVSRDLGGVVDSIHHAGKETKGFAKILSGLGGSLGDLGSIAAALFSGGLWTAGAKAMESVFDFAAKQKEKLLERIGYVTKSFDKQKERIEALRGEYAKLGAEIEKAQIQANAEAKAADAAERHAKAIAEQNRQKRIAAGENAATVNAEADAQIAGIEKEGKLRRATKSADDAKRGFADAENKAKSAAAELRKLEVERAELQEKLYKRASDVWNAENSFAAVSGMRLKRDRAAGYMADRNDKEYADIQAKIAENEEKIKAKKEAVSKADAVAAAAAKSQTAALEEQKAVVAEIAAAEQKEINERVAAEEEAARKVAEEKAAWLAKMESDAHQAEQEMLLHEAKMAEEEAEKERKIKEKLEADKKKAELKRIKEAADAQTKAIDKQIAEAKKAAEEWEQRAQGARGVSFSQWSVNKTRAERAAAREARRAEERRRSAEDEIRHIEERQRFGFDRNPHTNQRLARLREFVALQDPNNNPAAKQAKQLEARREQLAKETKKSIDDILALLQNNAAL